MASHSIRCRRQGAADTPEPLIPKKGGQAGTGVRLRPAAAEDSEFAYQVKKTTLGEYIRKVWGWDEDEQRRLHERRFATQDFQVIQVSGVDAGVLAVERRPDCLRVNQLLLLPEYQGRGIGTACMKQVLADAAGRGVPVRLQALRGNERALRFYRRLGFEKTGEDDIHIRLEKPVWRRQGQLILD